MRGVCEMGGGAVSWEVGEVREGDAVCSRLGAWWLRYGGDRGCVVGGRGLDASMGEWVSGRQIDR
jgi:hypothetical protein